MKVPDFFNYVNNFKIAKFYRLIVFYIFIVQYCEF